MATMEKKFEKFCVTLNKPQLEAVTSDKPALLVIAGAGSGKTRIITARIVHLIIQQNVPPSSIVALTFTNKAAKEMKERILTFFDGTDVTLPFIGTFHAYCLRILKQHAHATGEHAFSILDSDDQKKLISQILQHHNLETTINPKQVAAQISKAKNAIATPGEEPEHLASDPFLLRVYNEYEDEKRKSHCLDFDDLLIETLRLFKNNDEFKATFRERIRHILIDEYQDTNIVQHELIRQMAISKGKTCALDSVCVVGDEDQSIYSWRGATVENIANFRGHFAKTKVIKTEQNYRSVQPILDAAHTLIENNKNRIPKKLWSNRKASNRLYRLFCLSNHSEANAIIQFLRAAKDKYGLANVAILYRTHFQSRAIEEALVKNNVPYKIIGGTQFYERKEIKDILAYLRLIANPFDRTSLFRIINCPPKGLGKKFEDLIYDCWQDLPDAHCYEVLGYILQNKPLTKPKMSAVEEFLKLLEECKSKKSATEILEQLIKNSGYIEFLRSSCDLQDARNRIENVKELASAIAHFESQGILSLSDVLNEISLVQENVTQKEKASECVSLMTLHAAKGLEFDAVSITGLEEGIIPNSRSLIENDNVEEERRLLYVGITRAKNHVLLTHNSYRNNFGAMSDQQPSQFLREIPASLCKSDDARSWSHGQFYDFFAQWLGIQTEERNILTFSRAQLSRPTKATGMYYSQTRPASSNNSPWRRNQPVRHQKFGVGIVKAIQQKTKGWHLTVQFRAGTKKVDSKFLSRV